MFEYFPGNYVWNLSVLITLQNGGTIGEVDEACRPIREAAAGGVDAGTEQFYAAWSAVADRLVALAQEDEERGWTLSAGEKYRRAALYLLNAERMQSVHKPDRLAHYQRAIDLQHRGMRLARWGQTQRRRLQREGENPVPHYWDHALWVWGQDSMDDFEKLWDRITLDGVVEKITVPYLITHGANDRQIPVADAHRSYEQATNSPKRELKIFTAREGGVEHVNSDDQPNAARFTADWVAETFATATA